MNFRVFQENVRIAVSSIRGQLLRGILTALIIAIGIMALVGILTSIDAIKSSLTGQFALMGSNTFTIQNRGQSVRISRRGKPYKPFPKISFRQAQNFKASFVDPRAKVSLSYIASAVAQVSHQNDKTDPNISVWAADENYLATAGYEIEDGRNFSVSEIEEGFPVVLIGQDVRNQLFEGKDPIGQSISVGGHKLRVVGLLAPKGNSFGFGGDKSVIVPITKARTMFSSPNQSFALNVMSRDEVSLDDVILEATAAMRIVRRLKPLEEDSFYITKSDNLSKTLLENLRYVTIAAVVIGAITMLGAAIALMNIMLVSVTERTGEIGIRKAIGAKASVIRSQFLIEAILICLMGGFAGIVLGISMGLGVAAFIGGSFIIPWTWMGMAAVLCFLTGLVSGFYPASKASKLDPIEALRYE